MIANDGTIDWWCPHRYDAPATFYRLVDPRGGALRVGPVSAGDPGRQTYTPGTMVCETVLHGRDCTVSISDAMPWDGGRPNGRIVRLVTVQRGPADIAIELVPGRAFAAASEVSAWSEGVSFDGTTVRTGAPMEVRVAAVTGTGGRTERVLVAAGQVRLQSGERLVVTVDPPGEADQPPDPLSPDRAAALLERTATAWRRVVAPAILDGPYAEQASRCLLVLHGLGQVASPTTSLPEVIGSERGSDGRLIRAADVAAWAVAATAAGLEEDADAAVAWLVGAIESCPVPDVLGLDGSPPASERVLGLAGWRGSEPVRVGHDPPEQPSVDATAAVLDTATALAWLPAGEPLLDRWHELVVLTGWVARADLRRAGVARRLAVRRVLAAMSSLAWARSPLDLDAVGWHAVRKDLEAGLLRLVGTHRGALGDGADPALLRSAWLGPWPADDPVVRATIDRVRAKLGTGRWLLGGPEGSAASVVATLWLVRALAASGQWEEANLTMEAVLSVAGPLGLLPEWVDPIAGLARGRRPWMAAQVTFLEAARELAAGPL